MQMPRIRAAIAAVCVSILCATNFAGAADDRPRIGLVLGGGGARGAAHIGVLRELERLRVPIDAIAGTSMGAFVGGLYASGVTADELEELVLTLNWATVLADTQDRRDMTVRRKRDDEQYPIDLELGISEGELELPRGVVYGQNLELLIRQQTGRVAHIRDYSQLPIPYQTVATNIENGDPHVMSSGDLARSIRASMSVPGLIAPIEADGQLLVDGGIVMNLPIELVRSMNVDIIIAVDVEFPLYGPDELQSALEVSEQVVTILTRKETLRQIDSLDEDDILIRPALGTFASTNFTDIAAAIAPGDEAAAKARPRLAELSLSEADYAEHLQAREVQGYASDRLAFVRIDHDDRVSTDALMARLGLQIGDPVDIDALSAGAERLYSMDIYERVTYRLVEEGEQTGVEFHAEAKSWGPNFLNFGVAVEDDYDGATAFNVFGRYTRSDLNRYGAEWRTDIQLGTDFLLSSEFYQPLGTGRHWFVAPRVDLEEFNQNVFLSADVPSRLRVQQGTAHLDVGLELGSTGEFRVGAFRGTGDSELRSGFGVGPAKEDFDVGGVRAALTLDTFDDSRFPRHGYQFDVDWTSQLTGLGADSRYDRLASDFVWATSRGKNTVQLGAAYSTTTNGTLLPRDFTRLGGFQRLSGLDKGQVSGPHTALARLIYYRRVSDTTGGFLEVPVYLGASYEIGNAWDSRSDMSFGSARTNGSIFAAFDTYFGAIYAAVGLAEGGDENFYLLIGSPPRR